MNELPNATFFPDLETGLYSIDNIDNDKFSKIPTNSITITITNNNNNKNNNNDNKNNVAKLFYYIVNFMKISST